MRLRRFVVFGLLASLFAGNAEGDRRGIVQSQLERSLEEYKTVEDWGGRREQLRKTFLEATELSPMPVKTPLNVIIRDRREYDGYSVENVAIETMPGFYSTGNLYKPLVKQKWQSTAGILCPHGHYKDGRMRHDHQIRCANFARMGAYVFSYSMVGRTDYNRQVDHKIPYAVAFQSWNSIRAVDFLLSWNAVDPKRIGITGSSGGGAQAMYASMIDERIKVSAPVVIVYPWIPLTIKDCCMCEGAGLDIMGPAKTNGIEFAAAMAPRPQMLISVGKPDPTHDFPIVGFPFIKHVYGIHGAGDSVVNTHLSEEGHDFGPSKRKAVYSFFAKHLGLTYLPEDLSKITIEKPERMVIFDAKHPYPKHAFDLQGNQNVLNIFRSLPRGETASVEKKKVAMVELAGEKPPFYKNRLDAMTLIEDDGQEVAITTVSQWEKKQRHILDNMRLLFGPMPVDSEKCDLDIQIEEEVETKKFIRRKITYASLEDCRVPAYLFIPKNLKDKKVPAMLCLHQSGKLNILEPAGLGGDYHHAKDLAERGFVTIAPSYFPITAGRYDYDPYQYGYESWYAMSVWNIRRAIDLLESMDEVDSERIGSIGHSLGCFNTLFTAAFDERIKVLVCSAGVTSFAKHKTAHDKEGKMTVWDQRDYFPRVRTVYDRDPKNIPWDFPEMVAAIAPRPIFINAPLEDYMNPEAADDAVRVSAPVYELYGAEKRIEIVHPGGWHIISPEVQERMYEFVESVLKP